jgi:hypothetical protein
MAKLKLGAIADDKPVKLTVEIPASIHSDLAAYAEVLSKETGQSIVDPAKLVGPMLERFMAADRALRVARRTMQPSRGKPG